MAADRLKVLLVGLPGSGKTTFLAALWNAVRDPVAKCSLQLRNEPNPRAYFYDIERTWLGLSRLERSRFREPQEAILPLSDGPREFDLAIPDISGESYRELWERGELQQDVAEIARCADAILVFVRSDTVKYPALLELGEEQQTSLDDTEEQDEEPVPWKPAEAPTQTKLCDVLETLHVHQSRAVPTTLLISAWDMVRDLSVPPAEWLELNLPLLWQYFHAREDARPYRVLGVSAQGGDVDDPSIRADLAQIHPPSRRVLIQEGDASSSDITTPIQWLISQATSYRAVDL